ncbi:protein-L-isoaspartate O-methyltransferase [Thermodesulfatator indicus DSM 15286]|uniref:Protein-L-isoaspartate O-methyltransferase n=1 Tax=Thermodesulfatator indicus (strain DSM 15286 / JCM 11887 / CIR29812) TaxID=667014 RepID=F8A824_THEID|nr:protein-L-isoaspartate(D-aspartate) O-methyltransferase [Thermodesulfatator indicus]AEH45017.1 protein-L-isoaspartate O-methyltransferase [Thermodesulfatator indicus DSM 15286]
MNINEPDIYQKARERMVQTQIAARGIKDPRVLAAMLKVPRHLFVEEALKDQAYGDYPLPIGEGQTISQPYIVALMTEALELKGPEKVLEIGTGSGYQAAILAELARWVYSIERYPSLARRAKKILESLGYNNVIIKVGDGTKGWPEAAPFDAIIVTAAGPKIPEPLIEQLKDGGRLVMPVGDEWSQYLIKVTKKGDQLIKENLGAVRFVKLVGEYGFEE